MQIPRITHFLSTLVFCCLITAKSNLLVAQFQSQPEFGFQAGIVMNFGTHVNALGITGGIYYSDFFYQWNIASQLKYNFNSYGGRRKYWENRNALGLVLLGGKRYLTPDFQLDGLNHQTTFSKGIAFNYLWYYDQAGTSQRSGAFAIHVDYFSLAFENDIFAGQGRDKFRTGILQANYRYRDWKFFTHLYLWTGETRNSFWNKTSLPGCPNGYRCLDTLPYGKTSHGIIAFGTHRNLVYNQVVTLKTGFDSEQVRHFVQNKISHDLIFLPSNVKRNTPHYPRLDENGMPVFEKSSARKTRFLIQASLNEVWSN